MIKLGFKVPLETLGSHMGREEVKNDQKISPKNIDLENMIKELPKIGLFLYKKRISTHK